VMLTHPVIFDGQDQEAAEGQGGEGLRP
jgi:hypothetical protein